MLGHPSEAAPLGRGSRAWIQATSSALRPCTRPRGGRREALDIEQRESEDISWGHSQEGGKEGLALRHLASASPPSWECLLHPHPEAKGGAPPAQVPLPWAAGRWPWQQAPSQAGCAGGSGPTGLRAALPTRALPCPLDSNPNCACGRDPNYRASCQEIKDMPTFFKTSL